MIFARARLRLMVMNVAVMTVVIGLLGTGIVLVVNGELTAQASARLQADARHAADELRSGDTGDFGARHTGYASGTFYVVWSSSGTVLFDPAGAPTAPLRPLAADALAGRATATRVDLPGDQDMLVASVPLYQDGRLSGAVQAGQSVAPIHLVEEETLAIVAVVSGAALAAAVLASWFLAGRALVPVRRALERQREFAADASHELRTPLATIDAGVQLLRRHPEQTVAQNADVLDTIGGEARRMGRLVSDLLALARADSGEAELTLTEVDVDALVRSTIRELATVAGERAVSLRRVAAGTARLDGDRFKQLLLILVQNALRHAASAQPVEVSCYRRDRALVLEVADRGPGVPAHLRQAAFQRFHRLGPAPDATGSGLGLPIARWIATAHGGSITLHDNRPGLRVQVVVPAGQRAPERAQPDRPREPSPQ